MQNDIRSILTSIGMTSNECEIYLTLLEYGEITAAKAATKAGLHRQVCYDALERLIEKGFITTLIVEKKKYYKALNPTNLLRHIEEKQNSINSILPNLMSKYEEKKIENGVEFIKGKHVIKTIYNDIFETLKNSGDTLYIFGVEEKNFTKNDEIILKQHFGKMKHHNFYEKILTKKTATEMFESEWSQYAFLPDNLFNPNPVHIYKDKVAIIIWGFPLYGIVIHNKEFADSNKEYFSVLWDLAEKNVNIKRFEEEIEKLTQES